MNALDQAFIKAYVRHGAVPAASVLDAARPVSLAEALNGEPCEEGPSQAAARARGNALAEPAEETMARTTRKARGCPAKTAAVRSRRSSTDAERRPSGESARRKGRSRSGDAVKHSTAKRRPPAETGPAETAAPKRSQVKPAAAGPTGVKSHPASADRPNGRPKPEAAVSPTVSSPCPSVSAETLFSNAAPVEGAVAKDQPIVARLPEGLVGQSSGPSVLQFEAYARRHEPPAAPADARDQADTPPETTPPDAATPEPDDAAEQSVFRPMLEVDRFAWPTVVGRLDSGAGSPLKPLVDALVRGARQGSKAVAVVGCHRGDGCTTVALAASRALAREGLRVVLVDADFEDPRLAKRLGLAPELGWDEALAGRLPLAETAIESLHDRMVVLPVTKPLSDSAIASESPWDAAGAIDTLCRRYDVVLLDLGRVSKRSKDGIGAFESAGHWIDAAVLVHNVRRTSQIELTQAGQRLRAAGIVDVSIVENFV